MPDPNLTTHYGLPLQDAGRGSRLRLNQALSGFDIQLALQAQRIVDVQGRMLEVVPFGPYAMADDQVDVTLDFSPGAEDTLIFSRGGLMIAQGAFSWTGTTLTLDTPSVGGEEVTGIWLKLMFDPSDLVPTTTPGEYEETPTGVIDSTDGHNGNGTFTLSHNIQDGTTPHVQIDGFIDLTPYTHYTWAGNVITYTDGNKVSVGESHVVRYFPVVG